MKRLYDLLAVILLANSVASFVHFSKEKRRRIQKLGTRTHEDAIGDIEACDDRRAFLHTLGCLCGASYSAFSPASSAQARGLVSFPCVAPLLNVYHLMRAGTTLLEEQDIWSTNPLFLTNRESALSQKGVDEVRQACRLLQSADINPSVIKYSLAASAVDSAMVVRDELKVGQNRMIPEFTFMDPRAIGGWDMMSLQDTYPAIVALDEEQAGSDGRGARPPPNIDGTPNDTLADQAIRLRQLMSILETQFSGDNIVLVFPDGSSPALLSAMIAGIPYSKAHVLDFSPGEIRLDVTMEPTLKLYETKLKSGADAYDALLKSGQAQLARLRSIDDEDLVSKKDLMIEKERMEIEQEYQRKEEARLAKQEQQRGIDLARINNGRSPEDPLNRLSTYSVLGGAVVALAIAQVSLRPSQAMKTESDQGESDTASRLATVTRLQTNTSTVATPFEPPIAVERNVPASAKVVDEPLTPRATERLIAAQEAMQSYLDQDDGGSAWLQIMADIVDEVEEDDFPA
jgi:broad specificity phosphatase PhoE